MSVIPAAEIEELKKTACDVIDNASDELNSLSQDIWKNPETAYKEHKAHQLLTDFLANKGFDVQRNYVSKTGFAAIHPRSSKRLTCNSYARL